MTNCRRCKTKIKGELVKCGCSICGGQEGSVYFDGELVGRVYKDSATHATTEGCIAALTTERDNLRTALRETRAMLTELYRVTKMSVEETAVIQAVLARYADLVKEDKSV